MRLLVTRPEPDASRTAERLRALGHEVLVQPLLTIVFSPQPPDLPQPAAILVTSQNALRAVSGWPQAQAWRGTPVFVAGPATARAAEALGFADIRGGARDAGSLADRVVDEMTKNAGPLLYPAARDRAGALAGGLTALGYDVRVVEAYRADIAAGFDAPVRRAIASGALDGALLFSRRTATAFRDLAKAAGLAERLAGLACYVISAQVGEVLAERGATLHIAENPDEDSLLRLIPLAN